MNKPEKNKNIPSECCELAKSYPVNAYVYPESTYTGHDDDDSHSPHWMDRNHDYGGDED